jgi:hypothetical protein
MMLPVTIPAYSDAGQTKALRSLSSQVLLAAAPRPRRCQDAIPPHVHSGQVTTVSARR